jgi:hypothetical protein
MDAWNYIDFDFDMFIKESVLVMYYTKGGISLKELRELPFHLYEKYVEEAIRIQDMMNKKKPSENNLLRGEENHG